MEKENKRPKVFTFTLNGMKNILDVDAGIDNLDKYTTKNTLFYMSEKEMQEITSKSLKEMFKCVDGEGWNIKDRNERILKAIRVCNTYHFDIEDYLITHGLVRIIGYKPPKPFSKEAATKSMLGRINECESKIKKLESKILDLISENRSLKYNYDVAVRDLDKYKKVIREHFIVSWLFNKYM